MAAIISTPTSKPPPLSLCGATVPVPAGCRLSNVKIFLMRMISTTAPRDHHGEPTQTAAAGDTHCIHLWCVRCIKKMSFRIHSAAHFSHGCLLVYIFALKHLCDGLRCHANVIKVPQFFRTGSRQGACPKAESQYQAADNLTTRCIDAFTFPLD